MGMDEDELGSSEDDEAVDPNTTFREVEDVKAGSVPILLPLSEEMRKSGPGPNKAMSAAIVRALAPYHRALNAPEDEEDEEDGEEAKGKASSSNKASSKASKPKKGAKVETASPPPIEAPKLFPNVVSTKSSQM